MSHKLIKPILKNGIKIDEGIQQWHLSSFGLKTYPICQDEPDSNNLFLLDIKYVSRAGITCEDCIQFIKKFKKIKL
jgi:hypothetical protein